MPWKESSVMEERLRFVARLLEGERMSALARIKSFRMIAVIATLAGFPFSMSWPYLHLAHARQNGRIDAFDLRTRPFQKSASVGFAVLELFGRAIRQAMRIQMIFRNINAYDRLGHLFHILCLSCEANPSRIHSGLLEKTAVITL